jgi:hypothetical protein
MTRKPGRLNGETKRCTYVDNDRMLGQGLGQVATPSKPWRLASSSAVRSEVTAFS